jgi:xylose isomerase
MKTEPKCALITAFVSKTKDRFHEYNEDKTLEQRFEVVSRMADMTGVECIFPYETGRDADAFKALMAKYELQPSAINVNVKAEPEFRNGGLTSVDPVIRARSRSLRGGTGGS